MGQGNCVGYESVCAVVVVMLCGTDDVPPPQLD